MPEERQKLIRTNREINVGSKTETKRERPETDKGVG